MFSHEEVIGLLSKHFVWLLLTALVLGVSFCAVNFGKNYADAPVNRTVLFSVYAWFASLAVLGGAARYFDFETPFTRWMSKHSFGLYVFHYLGISSVAYFCGKLLHFPAPVCYLLSLVAGFAFGYGLEAVISRIPFFRWAVLGISKKKTYKESADKQEKTNV